LKSDADQCKSSQDASNLEADKINIDSRATSSRSKAALNAFKSSLEILGQTPLPGIEAITAALLRVIDGLQVIEFTYHHTEIKMITCELSFSTGNV
jgi:hypothetical protein